MACKKKAIIAEQPPVAIPVAQPVVATNGKALKCPVSRAHFAQHAKHIVIQLGDRQLVALPKQFSTGSFGWSVNDKVTLDVGGVPVKVQVGINLTIVGSKEVPDA